MTGRTGALNDVIQFPKLTQYPRMSILSSKDCIVGGHDIPSFALVEKTQTHLRHRIVRLRYPNHADGDGILHVSYTAVNGGVEKAATRVWVWQVSSTLWRDH